MEARYKELRQDVWSRYQEAVDATKTARAERRLAEQRRSEENALRDQLEEELQTT